MRRCFLDKRNVNFFSFVIFASLGNLQIKVEKLKKKIAKYYLEKRVIKNYQSCEFISKLEYWGRDRDIFYLLILFFIF